MTKEGYIRISLLDVIRVSRLAKQNNDEQKLIDNLIKLFINIEDELEITIKADCAEAKLILKYNKSVELKSYITLESVGLAYNKLLISKSNKELLKRIEKYFRLLLDCILNGDDNTEIKQEIISDEEAFELIKQHSTYLQYEKEIFGAKAKKMILINNQQEQNSAIKGKAILD